MGVTKDILSVPYNYLSIEDTNRHIDVFLLTNDLLSKRIKAAIADEAGRKKILKIEEKKKEGITLDADKFLTSKIVNNKW